MMKPWVLVVAAASLVGATRIGQAQPGSPPPPPPDDTASQPPPPDDYVPPPPPGPPQPVVLAPVAPATPAGVPLGVMEDANSGRNWLTPTALMPPKGTFTFSDFELFVVGASYAITDDFQMSASTLLPVVSDMPFLGILSAKARLYHSPRVHLAAQGSVLNFTDDDDSATAFALGGALTLCLDDNCYSYASGYVGVGFAYEDNSSVPIGVSGTIVARVAQHVKLMVELDTGGVLGELDAAADGLIAWYGVRFTSRNIGVDLGFLKPICSDCDVDELPLGLPFIAVSYRAI